MTDMALHNAVETQVAQLEKALSGCSEPHLTIALGNFRRVVWELEKLRATCERMKADLDWIAEER